MTPPLQADPLASILLTNPMDKPFYFGMLPEFLDGVEIVGKLSIVKHAVNLTMAS